MVNNQKLGIGQVITLFVLNTSIKKHDRLSSDLFWLNLLNMIETTGKLFCWLLFTGIALVFARETTFHVRKSGLGENSYDSLVNIASSIDASNTSTVIIIIQETELVLPSMVQFPPGIRGIRIEGNGTNISCSPGLGGLRFWSMENVQLHNFTLHGCGKEELYGSALIIEECTNITMTHISVVYSKGIGLTLIDNYGQVDIQWMNVTGTYHKRGPGAGIVVNFTNSLSSSRKRLMHYQCFTTITLQQCTIENNRAERGIGGGLLVYFYNSSTPTGVNVSIVNCSFHSNHAVWGGGIYVKLHDLVNVAILIQHCIFIENTAKKSGGGLVCGYSRKTSQPSAYVHKMIKIERATFANNRAEFGGGCSVYGEQSNTKESEAAVSILFRSCTWNGNVANFGTAVDIAPNVYEVLSKGFLIIPQFVDCSFVNNSPNESSMDVSETRRSVTGAFVVSLFEVEFGGRTTFMDNRRTALHTISGKISIQSGSHVIFINNSGVKGGAVAMYGFSQLYVWPNTRVEFINNSAVEEGGGIYHHTFDRHDFVSNRVCFIRHHLDGVKYTNVTYIFQNNTAKRGPSIFTLTFAPCKIFWGKYKSNFQLDQPSNKSIATIGTNYNWTKPQPFTVVPGQERQLPISMIDEFNNEAHPLYRLSVTSDEPNSSMGLDREYTFTRAVRFLGNQNEIGTLRITQTSFMESSYNIKVSVLPCPPGYISVSLQDNEGNICQCSADTDSRYKGINNCNVLKFQAYIERDYWAGISNDDFCTSQCPLEFCKYHESDALLPQNRSELEAFICQTNRTGVLCGGCAENLSLYFHSPTYKCGSTNHCHLSPLFYILSEVLPMFILFTIIIFLNVRFTSGITNGFVLFCQIANTLTYRRGAHRVPSSVRKISLVYKLIYGAFNLDFFQIDSLSFCLWPSATMLDILSFKFVTIAIAFLLMMSLVMAMRYCHCSALNRIKMHISNKGESRSIIHGLTTFLIISYTQCVTISFQILVPVILTEQGGRTCNTVAYHGGMHYFGPKHLIHAIIALVSITTAVSIPPIVLITFPGYTRLLDSCGLSDNQVLNRPAMKLKPLLDSFQSCFKDNRRFFAGVYLLYRVVLSAGFAFCTNLYHFYAITELILIIMLAVHSVVQPYKCRVHNIVDSLLFLDLAVINGITTYFFTYPVAEASRKLIKLWFWIQMALLYLPLLCMSAYLVWKCVAAARAVVKDVPHATADDIHELCVPRDLQDESSEDNSDIPYEEFELDTDS